MAKTFKTILVTGSPRGGTTAIGKMLALGLNANILYEPFNLDAGVKGITKPFLIPNLENDTPEKWDKHIENILNLDLNFKKGLRGGDKGFRKAIKSIIGSRGINSYRLCKINPFLDTLIWKDPLACFFADIVAEKYNIDVLVTMRNPYAVSGSFKRLDMKYTLSDIYERAQSLNVNLEHIQTFLSEKKPALNSAILWNIIYSTLFKWAKNEKINFVNTEEILESPAESYKRIYNKLDLPFNKRIKKKVKNFHSQSSRKEPKTKKSHDFKRDPKSFNHYYSEVLNGEEMDFISSLNGDLWEEVKKLSFLKK